MKRFFAFLIVAVAFIGFAACSDGDDGNNKQKNILQIGGVTYPVGAAYCHYWRSIDGFAGYDIYITDKVHWDNNGMWNNDMATYANSVKINLYNLYANTAKPETIPDGTYVYYGSDNKQDFSHDGSSDYTIYDENGIGIGIEMGQRNIETSELNITINHIRGNTYEISFTDAFDEDGIPVSGYYRGTIAMFGELTI